MKFSIIIPCMEINDQTIKCIKGCLDLDYEDFEILVLPDKSNKRSYNKKLRIVDTGKVKPALKRNIGMELASGDFFAFIDDDAYPKKDWLNNVKKYFDDEKIGLVGGPNLTPDDVNFAEKVSGIVLSNFLVLGPASIRYKIDKNQYAKELPSCNYISRRMDIKYDINLLTAEDSKFCFDIKKSGYEVYYANDVVVYHHRRDSFWKHIKQMYVYGRDIIVLARKEPSYTKIYYTFPSLGLIGFVVGLIWSLFNPFIRYWFGLIVVIYLMIMLFSSLNKDIKTIPFVWVIGVITHFAYGVGGIVGLFGKREDEKVKWNSR